jgi:plastocyanin
MMACPLQKFAFLMAVGLSAMLLAGCGEGSREANSGAGTGGAAGQAVTNDAVAKTSVSGESTASEPVPGPNQIIIDHFAFRPARLTVPVGTKVTWINRDDVPHTATSTAKPKHFNSGTLDTDDHFAHVFTAPGTYEYFCAVHPHMTAQVIVK